MKAHCIPTATCALHVSEVCARQDGAEEGEGTAGMSAAAKKKAKKKAKEKEKKADGGAKAPKVSAAVRKMQEAQEARLRAEAEQRAAEEERIRLVRACRTQGLFLSMHLLGAYHS